MGTVTRLNMSPGLLHSPRHGRDVCVNCFNLTRGFHQCFACSRLEQHLAAMLPISYSVGHEYLHHILADYKRLHDSRGRSAAGQVTTMLSMFLVRHEACLARAAGVARFGLVTTVPSGDAERDRHHPLRQIVGEFVEPTSGRYERVLNRTRVPVEPRVFEMERFRSSRRLDGENILLIDDTWTTGASAQSAAAALRAAGAASVAAVVVGRHLNRDWYENDQHLDGLPFDWDRCAICSAETAERDGARPGTGPDDRLRVAA